MTVRHVPTPPSARLHWLALAHRGLVLAVLTGAISCAGQVPEDLHQGETGKDPDAAPANTTADARPSPRPDATPTLPGSPDATTSQPGTPDAALPPDAAPVLPSYPSGPYGTRAGDVMANLSWIGYSDDNGDGDPVNDGARQITLGEFYVGNDSGARVLLLSSGAGWCGPCADEAPELAALYRNYQSRGGRVVTVLFEDYNGNDADAAFAEYWSNTFDLPMPTVADPNELLNDYYVDSAVPMNMFVDLETMKIIDVIHGWDNSYGNSIFGSYAD